MSENPYAAQSMHSDPQGPMQSSDFGSQMPSGPARTSVLAILSLLFSLVCFIPGLSTIGSVLGVFAIIGIAKSGGRVKGTGLAVAGMIVGLLVTIIWIGLGIGISQRLQQYATLGAVVAEIQDDDEPAVRARLTASANEQLTAADLAAFKAEFQADAGTYQGVPTGIGPMFASFSEIGQAGTQPDPARIPYQNPVPLPGNFDNGSRLMWIVIDPEEVPSSGVGPAYINVAIELSDGTIAWLIDPQGAGREAETPAGEGDASEEQPAAEPESESAPEAEAEPEAVGAGG